MRGDVSLQCQRVIDSRKQRQKNLARGGESKDNILGLEKLDIDVLSVFYMYLLILVSSSFYLILLT